MLKSTYVYLPTFLDEDASRCKVDAYRGIAVGYGLVFKGTKREPLDQAKYDQIRGLASYAGRSGDMTLRTRRIGSDVLVYRVA